MGQFHFDVPDSVRDHFERTRWKDASICGIEGIPWQCKSTWRDGRLTVHRSIDSSGKLHLVCPVGTLGLRSLSTCSLRATQHGYPLHVELARGSAFRLQWQADQWQRSGLSLDDDLTAKRDQGMQQFLDAACCRQNPAEAASRALKAIVTLEEAMTMLGEAYTHQSIAYRTQQEVQIGTLLAAAVVPPSPDDSPNQPIFTETFNAAAVRVHWPDIENDSGRFDASALRRTVMWCHQSDLRVIGGPIIDFRERLIPDWLYLLNDDFETFLSSALQFAERTIEALRGSVHLWIAASGLNTRGPINLDEERAMRLAVGILQIIRRIDPRTPAIMSFEQPFGEYLAKTGDGISPLHFADALARSGLGMAGLGLDIRLNYQSDATHPRSVVDFGAAIDRWATLGLPLLVSLTVPGGAGVDDQAIARAEAIEQQDLDASPHHQTDAKHVQLNVAAPLVRTLLAKHAVHGIVWDGWSDAEPHIMGHSGILDAAGQPRPIQPFLSRLRQDLLS